MNLGRRLRTRRGRTCGDDSAREDRGEPNCTPEGAFVQDWQSTLVQVPADKGPSSYLTALSAGPYTRPDQGTRLPSGVGTSSIQGQMISSIFLDGLFTTSIFMMSSSLGIESAFGLEVSD